MTTKKRNSYLATIFGLITAIANAWITIDWDGFLFTPNNIMKLGLSAIIAIGGASSSMNFRGKEKAPEKSEA